MPLNCDAGEVPWTARRSSQSVLKEINPEYSLEGLMLKLKLQYFGHLMQRTDSLEKTWCWERLKAGGEGDDRGWDGWIESLTQWTWICANSRRWWSTGKPGVLQSMRSQSRTQLSDWTTAYSLWEWWWPVSLPSPNKSISPHLPETHNVWEWGFLRCLWFLFKAFSVPPQAPSQSLVPVSVCSALIFTIKNRMNIYCRRQEVKILVTILILSVWCWKII